MSIDMVFFWLFVAVILYIIIADRIKIFDEDDEVKRTALELSVGELEIIRRLLLKNDDKDAATDKLLEKIEHELSKLDLEEFNEDAQWFEDNREEIEVSHGGEFVAIKGKKILQGSNSLDYLLGWLVGAGYDPAMVYVTYVTKCLL
ncbi:MAG: hypothetical protein ACTSPB_05120 [Candidatus Thorarchaeota archaeon]